MKRIITSILTVLCMWVTVFAFPLGASAETLKGDISGNGKIDLQDAIIVAKSLLGIVTFDETEKEIADINSDGKVDLQDAIAIAKYLLNNKNPEPKSDILVAYFSCTNNTKGIAEHIINYLNADSYEIVPKVPYTTADLNYNTDCRANREQNDDTARPEISGGISNMNDYSTVFIGYPIWWGQAPKIMYTFLESYDFSGKTIIPFCTSGSSLLGSSAKNLSTSAPNSTWLEGKRFSGNAKESEVTSWVDSMSLVEEQTAEYFYITANDTTFKAKFAENSSADAFKKLLSEKNLTIQMSDYGSFEKVGSLGTTLPQNNEQITTEPGDVILYQGDKITVYYDKNSWNFTRLGKIENVTKEELLDNFGKGDVEITFSIKGVNP